MQCELITDRYAFFFCQLCTANYQPPETIDHIFINMKNQLPLIIKDKWSKTGDEVMFFTNRKKRF